MGSRFGEIKTWYVELHGPGPTDEIGTIVEADNGDDAVTTARLRVKEDYWGRGEELGLDDVNQIDSWTVTDLHRADDR